MRFSIVIRPVVVLSLIFSLGSSLLLTTSCRTTPKVDWNSRIGTYTYDQAVTELGPPDKTATLTDGRTVADWITGYKRGSSLTLGTGMGVFGGHSGGGVSVGQTVGGGTSAKVLRLTFDQEQRLLSWSR